MADMYPGWSPYNYCMQNPVNLIDPTGMSSEKVDPVFRSDGTYLTETKEGYEGEIIIYDGDDLTIDEIRKMSAEELLKNECAWLFDDAWTTAKAKSKVYTNVLCSYLGLETSKLLNGYVSVYQYDYNAMQKGYSNYSDSFNHTKESPVQNNARAAFYKSTIINNKIGVRYHNYTPYFRTTVENIANFLGVHEFIMHFQNGVSAHDDDHYRAAFAQLEHFTFEKMTNGAKGYAVGVAGYLYFLATGGKRLINDKEYKKYVTKYRGFIPEGFLGYIE